MYKVIYEKITEPVNTTHKVEFDNVADAQMFYDTIMAEWPLYVPMNGRPR